MCIYIYIDIYVYIDTDIYIDKLPPPEPPSVCCCGAPPLCKSSTLALEAMDFILGSARGRTGEGLKVPCAPK